VAVLGLIGLASQGELKLPGNGAGGIGGGGSVNVVYRVTGSATGASITFTDGSGNIQQQTGVDVPLTRKSGGDGLQISTHHGAFVSILAQNAGASGDLSCSITADGVLINSGHASGAYAITTCSTTVP
jgi:hypothetical protein